MNVGTSHRQDTAFGASSDVPLFVRGVDDPSLAGGDGFDDGDLHELSACQEQLADATTLVEEATARSVGLEQELEAQARKRMGLEQELNDVHREHRKEMAVQQAAHEQLRNDFEKLQHYNMKLREELLRTNRELIGVLAKRNEIRKEADRAARQNMRNELRQEQQQAVQPEDDVGGDSPAVPTLAAPAARWPLGAAGPQPGLHEAPYGQAPYGLQSRPAAAPPLPSNVNPLAAVRSQGPGTSDDDPARSVRSRNALNDLRDFFDM